jgi:tRNA1(Val) A37 N6-methylase TrmN6
MKQCNYTNNEKLDISREIKPITEQMLIKDYLKLINIGVNSQNESPRCRTGNNTVDYFTFHERLNTKGKYNTNYYEFICNLDEFKKKKFIQNMLNYYHSKKNKKKEQVILKETYNICISAVNIFRPLIAMDIYNKYTPKSVLDFSCGWGGRLIGACALNINKYTGIDINSNLQEPYLQMTNFLNKHSTTNINMIFQDATTIDYSLLYYDMVLTSPPYYGIEKYSNNKEYKTKTDMNINFYIPLITNTFKYLQKNGHFCLNVNNEIYKNVCIQLLGEAHEIIQLKKSKRQNNYTENIYIWIK